jgi:hypothetical protein
MTQSLKTFSWRRHIHPSLSQATPSVTSKSLLKVLGQGASFADYRITKIQGGNGGDGSIAFLKAPSQDIGPPNGGNGGRGGDVYIIASKNHQSLNAIQDQYRVENGGFAVNSYF